ncbi:MAG: mobile mystery protein B [Leptospiraceae bacterium]|nr:mobile mystery protein B [Leptospiraceae bacterium]
MGLDDLQYVFGQTPLSPEEKVELKIKTISNREELNEFEELNIEKAVEWSLVKKFKRNQVFSEKFILELHKKMFGDVWKWAGKYRLSNKNIGVDKFQIGIKIKNLLDDCNYWIENKLFSEDEIAIRFKHRLVAIHPFPNGNGRHSRLMADIIAKNVFHRKVFSWGRYDLFQESKLGIYYIPSLKMADKGDYTFLLKFARS